MNKEIMNKIMSSVYTNVALEVGIILIQTLYEDVQSRYVDGVWDDFAEIAQQEEAIKRGLA